MILNNGPKESSKDEEVVGSFSRDGKEKVYCFKAIVHLWFPVVYLFYTSDSSGNRLHIIKSKVYPKLFVCKNNTRKTLIKIDSILIQHYDL